MTATVEETRNRYLRGGFAPVHEEVTAFDLPVIGRIPAELNGRYLRNGPNPVWADAARYHWFLGDGMVHGVRLRDGRAEWYRNRFVRQTAVTRMLGEPPRRAAVYAGVDVPANTHVIGYSGKTLALVEGGTLPYELSYELETIGTHDFAGTLPGGFTAHPKLDPVTGELHAVAYVAGSPYVKYHVITPDGRVGRVEDILVPSGTMMHDFALTAENVVIFDLPVVFSIEAAMTGELFPYAWSDTHQARIGVMPRSGSGQDIRWVDIPPVWIFHSVNAFDDGGKVVLDAVTYPRLAANSIGSIEGNGLPTLNRYVLDPAAGSFKQTRLDDRPQEFPRINERMLGVDYRYGYTAVTGDVTAALATAVDLDALGDDVFTNQVIKHDLAQQSQQVHTFGRGEAVGEPVYTPRPGATAEDDGYLMFFVHDPDRSATDLVIHAAQDIASGPLARIQLPSSVPLGLHGSWIPDAI